MKSAFDFVICSPFGIYNIYTRIHFNHIFKLVFATIRNIPNPSVNAPAGRAIFLTTKSYSQRQMARTLARARVMGIRGVAFDY